MSCSTISSARTFSLGVLVGNFLGGNVGDGVGSVVFGGFGAGV